VQIVKIELTYSVKEVEDPTHNLAGKINRASQVYEIMRFASYFPTEHLWVVLLKEDRELLGISEVAIGTSFKADFEPREVMRVLLSVRDCKKFLLVHNHPGGDHRPSPQDIEVTSRIKLLAEMFGIDMIDHIVISERGWENILTPKRILASK
jgi:DNA repair protein RadC